MKRKPQTFEPKKNSGLIQSKMNHIVCHVERRRSIITEKDKKKPYFWVKITTNFTYISRIYRMIEKRSTYNIILRIRSVLLSIQHNTKYEFLDMFCCVMHYTHTQLETVFNEYIEIDGEWMKKKYWQWVDDLKLMPWIANNKKFNRKKVSWEAKLCHKQMYFEFFFLVHSCLWINATNILF